MNSAPRTVLVTFGTLPAAAAPERFRERFPGLDLAHVPYRLPEGQRTARVADPEGSAAVEPPLTAEQAEAYARAEILLAMDAPRDLPAVAPNLRWIQIGMSGVTSYSVCGLDGSGITLTNTAGITASSIAEWVLGRIIAIHKRFDEHAEQQRARVWRAAHGDDVAGRAVLVVGLGAIGTEVARLCSAVGMTVVGVRRTPCPPGAEPPGVTAVRPPGELRALAGRADVVVGALPSGSATADVFDADLFAAMRPGSVFLNVGRGTSVDETALAAALASGHLRGAAVDVARHEPLPADSPLWDVPRLNISPHSSASITGYLDRVWDLFARNLDAYLAGRPLRNLVRPEDLRTARADV
jgi:phosphoglycerate dehydrogenase-like enzyme